MVKNVEIVQTAIRDAGEARMGWFKSEEGDAEGEYKLVCIECAPLHQSHTYRLSGVVGGWMGRREKAPSSKVSNAAFS